MKVSNTQRSCRKYSRDSRALLIATLCVGTLVISACSSDSNIQGGVRAPTSNAPSPTEQSLTPSPEPSTLAEGVLEPTNAPTPPPQDPSIPRADEAQEAAKYAQAFATSLLYFNVLYVPNAEKMGASLMQAPPGLSITRVVEWYEYVKSDAAYAKNRQNVDGYLFVPPERGERRYAVPAIQDIQYSSPIISAGDPSSIDSRPTLVVSFDITGTLIWTERDGSYWQAPVKRDISYTMASQNDGWVVDKWKNTSVEIGKAEPLSQEEAEGLSFTPWEANTEFDIPFMQE